MKYFYRNYRSYSYFTPHEIDGYPIVFMDMLTLETQTWQMRQIVNQETLYLQTWSGMNIP